MAETALLIFIPSGPPRAAGRASAGGGAVAVPFALDRPPAEAVEAAWGSLRAAGHAGQAAVLAIPSGACLCAPIRSHDLPARDRRRAMLYRLEEKIPVSAEEVVADFIPAAGGALGVCAARSLLAPRIEALEARGVPVAAVCPTSLLALQRRLESAGDEPYDAVVRASGDRVELVLLSSGGPGRPGGGRPRGWYVLSNDPKDLLLHLKLETFNGGEPPRRLLAVGLSRPALGALAAGGAQARVTEGPPASVGDEAAEMAERILADHAVPWVDLRAGLGPRDVLRPIRTPLRFAAAAVGLCLLSLCGAMLWRSAGYDRQAAGSAREQAEVFRRTFPRQPEPEDVRSRLASEERGLRGLSGDPAAPPPRPPGLLALRDLLARLPVGVRFRLLEVRLDGAQFALEGQARSHGDADAIASALREQPGFSVGPPRTEQLAAEPGSADATEVVAGAPAVAGAATAAATPAGEKVVAFTITGTVADPAAGPGPATRRAPP